MGSEEALRERNEELEREIARRRQVEEELREAQGFLASLLEHAPLSIYVASTDGRLRLVNRAWEEFWGLSREKAIGLRSEQVYPAAQARQYLEANQRVIDGAAPTIVEEIGDAPDGRHYFHTVKFPLRGAHGEIEAVGGVSVDITERKQMEEALRQRNLDLEVLNRAARAFSSTLDLDQVLAIVLEEIRSALGVAACSVWLIDRTRGDLVCLQATGPESNVVRGWRLAPGEGIVGWVVAHGESAVVSDTRSDERHVQTVDREIGFELRSVLSVPLRVTQGVIGAIQVLDTQVGRFTAADLSLIEPLAATAAVAIENARLYEEAEGLIAELREALANIKTLKGLIPICASCKKIRTDEGFWQQVDVYIRDHSEVEFSHGLCPDCLKKLYPEFARDE
jgi:PAS domain S-box-containing protein